MESPSEDRGNDRNSSSAQRSKMRKPREERCTIASFARAPVASIYKRLTSSAKLKKSSSRKEDTLEDASDKSAGKSGQKSSVRKRVSAADRSRKTKDHRGTQKKSSKNFDDAKPDKPKSTKKCRKKVKRRRSRDKNEKPEKVTSEKHSQKTPKSPQSLYKAMKAKVAPGTTVVTFKTKLELTVKKLLGSGGFGDVYLVEDKQGSCYAMKTEYRNPKKYSRLRHEGHAYEQIKKQHLIDKSRVTHLLLMIDYGQLPPLCFLVITLVGEALEDLLEKYEISWKSACRLCIGTLNAIEQVHSLGLVHRDIKPANFAIGLAPDDSHVYLMDLGICSKFPLDECDNNAPSKYKFIGSLRYAPRAAHLRKVQLRRDDLESWMYMIFEFFSDEALPWRGESDIMKVCELKETVFKTPSYLLSNGPDQFAGVLKTIADLGSFDKPDYEKIREDLQAALKREEEENRDPLFEWVKRVEETVNDNEAAAEAKSGLRPVIRADDEEHDKKEPTTEAPEKKLVTDEDLSFPLMTVRRPSATKDTQDYANWADVVSELPPTTTPVSGMSKELTTTETTGISGTESTDTTKSPTSPMSIKELGRS